MDTGCFLDLEGGCDGGVVFCFGVCSVLGVSVVIYFTPERLGGLIVCCR